MNSRKSPTRRRGRGLAVLLLLAALMILAPTLMLLPLLRCRSCKGVYEERMRQAKAPGISAEHAALIRAWAESDDCSHCRKGRVSLLDRLLGHDPGPWQAPW